MTETLTTEQVEEAPEFVAHFKSGRPLPHPLFDYWTSLDGKTGELGYQWSDKPHRHVFDLINEVVHLRTELLALRKRVGELEASDRPTHRHKRRGTAYAEYVLIGIGRMQAQRWHQRVGEKADTMVAQMPTVDMREVAIYRSVDDGSLWVRPREEFEDGRFEALPAHKEPS